MVTQQQVAGGIFRTGFNDRRTQLFENLWPLPGGISYNSYVVVDQKCALIDAMHTLAGGPFIESVEAILEGRKLDYLVINHMEPDHSGEIEQVLHLWPEAKIVGNKRTFSILEAYFGRKDNLVEVGDGEVISLGGRTLQFFLTPWVHWPETMMTFETTTGTLFSGDVFGMFGATEGGVFDDQVVIERYQSEARRYFSNVVGKYSNMVQKAIEKLKPLPIKAICPLHGLVWRADPARIVGLYDRWSSYAADNAAVVIYGSIYGYTAQMADHIAYLLAGAGVKDIRVYDSSKTHLSYLIDEIWRCRGVVLGSCAYNTQMFPAMAHLTTELEHIGLKNRLLGLFGTFSWNGGGVRNLGIFAQNIGWEMVSDPVEIQGAPTPEKLAPCAALASAMAARLR